MAHPFSSVPEGKLESLNALQAKFRKDVRLNKVDLMCGVYQTEDGKPYVLPSVELARQILIDDPDWEHEYPSSHLGEAFFRHHSLCLQYGSDSQHVKQKRIASMQALGASGACHMGAMFLRAHYEPYKIKGLGVIYIPSETWVNHPNVFHAAGFETTNLPYYDISSHKFAADRFIEAINEIPSQSVVVLQVCGNNPTGCDPTSEEWLRIASVFKSKQHFAFLDLSYPGFVSGNVEQDCEPVRLFVSLEIPLLLATTYGKAFGLYGERVGHLSIPLPNNEVAMRVEQQMKLLARAETGAQPRFGAQLVANILQDLDLKRVWEQDLRHIAQDLIERRQRLENELCLQDNTMDWSFVTKQAGMFLFTSLDRQQIDYMRETCAVYLQDTGRLSIAGLNKRNTALVARSIVEARKLAKGHLQDVKTSRRFG